jgi:hypothetical protein
MAKHTADRTDNAPRRPGESPDVADEQAESRNPDTGETEHGRNGFGGSYDDRDEQGRSISRDDGRATGNDRDTANA